MRRSLLNSVILATWHSKSAVKRSRFYALDIERLESRQLLTGSIFGELRLQPAAPVIVNEPYSPTVTFTDDGAELVRYLAVNWGDNSPIEIVPADVQPSRRYTTAGAYSIAISAFDESAPLPPATSNAAGAVVVEASRFSAMAGSGASVWKRLPSTQGALSAVELAANAAPSLYGPTLGARIDYDVSFASAGIKYAWVRMRSPDLVPAALQIGLNGTSFSNGGQGISTSSDQWEWIRTVLGGPANNRLNVSTTAGAATLNLWSYGGRVQVDQVLLTPDINFTPIGRLQETRSLVSSYAGASTTLVVTPGFQSTLATPAGSLLPIAAVDSETMLSGQSILVPVTRNDFDLDGQAISLISAKLEVSNHGASWFQVTTPAAPTVSVESGNLRIRALDSFFGTAEYSYVIQDATNNRATGRLFLSVTPPSNLTPQTSPFNAGTATVSPAAKYVTREETDITLPSAGIPIELKRSYSSDRTDDQGFGPGWAFNYGTYVNLAANGASFVWTKPDGTTESYTAGTTTNGITPFGNALGNGTTAFRTVFGATTTVVITTKYGERYQFNVAGQRGRLEEIRDRNNNVQSVTYAANGLISQVAETLSGSTARTRLNFASNGNRISAVNDDKGRSWNYEYAQTINSNSYLTRVLLPFGVVGGLRQSTTYQYATLPGSTGLMSKVIERTGELTQFEYYPNGRLDLVKTAGVVTARYLYDDATGRRETTDGTGVKTIEKFNSYKAVLERSVNGVIQVLNEYDTSGRLTKVTGTGEDPVLLTYDAKGNILTHRAVNGVYTKFDYDPNFSQVTRIVSDVSLSVTTDDIVVSTRTLDARGNLLEEVDALLNKTIRTYDASGQVTSITDPRGASTASIVGDFTTEFVYNTNGQLIQRKLPTSIAPTGARPVETLTYDNFYNLLSQTDPTGITTTFQYDRIGQLLSKSLPAPYPTVSTTPITTRIEYDNFGRVIAQIDGRGNRTEFQWDASGRVARQSFPNGADIRTTYDAVGRPLTVRNENGLVTRYEYALDGNLRNTIFPDGSQRANLGPSMVREADGGYTSIGQNSKGQTTQSMNTSGGVTTWTYNTRDKSRRRPIGAGHCIHIRCTRPCYRDANWQLKSRSNDV